MGPQGVQGNVVQVSIVRQNPKILNYNDSFTYSAFSTRPRVILSFFIEGFSRISAYLLAKHFLLDLTF